MEEKSASGSLDVLKSEQQKAKVFLFKMIGLFTSTQYVELHKYLAEEQNVFFANVNRVLLSNDTNAISNRKDLIDLVDLIEDKVLNSSYMRTVTEPVVMAFKARLQELLASFYLRNMNESTSIADAININAQVSKYACQAQKNYSKLNDKTSSFRLDSFLIQVESRLFKKLIAQTPEEGLFNKVLTAFDFKAVDLDVDDEVINKIATIENLLRLKYLEISKDDLNEKLISAYINPKLSKLTSVCYPKFYQEFSRLIAVASNDKDKQAFRAWQAEFKLITDQCKPVGELKKLFTTISDFSSSNGTANLQTLIELLKRFMPCYQMHVSLTQSILHKTYEKSLYEPNTSTLLKLEHQLPFGKATISKYLDIIRNQVPAFMRDNSLALNSGHVSSEAWSTTVFQAQAELARSFCRLLNRLAYGVELLLGLDSTQEITLLLLGSTANNTLTPYSDVEYALINQKSYAEVQSFASLFNYQINKLGEWSEDKNGNLLHEGFCVDPGANPAIDTRLAASAAVLPSQFNRDEDARWRLHDGMAYALFNPLAVYNFSHEIEYPLIQQYEDANKHNQQSAVPLAELPKLFNGECIYHGIDRDLPLHKACALAYLERDLHSYCEENASDAVGTIFPDFTGVNGKYKSLGESFCAKKRLVKPLSYMLLDLALYTGVSTETIEGAIEGLCSAQNNVPAKLASHLKEELRLAIAQLTVIRYRQQYFYKKQRDPETIVIPSAANKQEYKDYYILNDEEQGIIQSIETRFIWPFYQVFVTGLLNRNSVTELDQFKNLDPALYLMEELLAQVKNYYLLEKKPEVDEQLAKNIIAGYILTLVERKVPYAQHQKTYDELPVFLQQHYCHYLQQYEQSAEAAKLVSLWQTKLAWFPEPNGQRSNVRQQQQKWQNTCDKLIIPLTQWNELIAKPPYAGEKLPLLFIRRVVQAKPMDCAFHPEAVKWLLRKNVINDDGFLQPRNKHAPSIREIKGQHLVVPIDVIIDDIRIRVHLKFFPELPGMEYAAGSLSRLLVGCGSPLTELVRLEILNVKLPIPLLIMETVIGDDLDTHAKVSPDLANLQPEFFGKAVMQAIALNREDGKGDNTYLTPCPLNPTQLALVLIDSERCFFPAVGRDEKDRLIPYVKEIIFCLPQMLNKIHLSVAKEFLALDIYSLIKHWLIDLQAESLRIDQLFNKTEMKVLFPQEAQASGAITFIKKFINTEKEFITNSILPMTFLENDIGFLYKKLNKMQLALREQLDRSYLELLSIAESMLAQYYQRLLELKITSVKERFAKGFVTTGLYQLSSAGHQLSRMPSQQILQTAKGRQVKITDLLDKPNRLVKEISYELEQAVKKSDVLLTFKTSANPPKSAAEILELLQNDPEAIILDEVNFKDIKDTKVFLEKLLTIPTAFRYLRLLNCKSLTGALLNQIRKQFPSLQKLNISGCTQLQASDLRNLALSPGLTRLIANRHTQLQELRLEAPVFSGGLLAEAYFAHLEHLELSECSNLRSLICKTPDLKSIKLKENKQLKKLQIEAKALETVDFRGSSFENDAVFLLTFFNIHKQLTEMWVSKNDTTSPMLKKAIKDNNRLLTRALLVSPDFHTKKVLKWCCEGNKWDIIQYLLEKSPLLINYRDPAEESILMLAVKAGKQELVHYLLDLKEDVMVQNKRGEAVFSLACEKGYLSIAEQIFAQNQAVLNLLYGKYDRRTPLMQAVKSGKKEVIEFLLRLKADVMIQDDRGETVFHMACKAGDLELAKRLYACDPRLLNYGKMTGLMSAAEAGKQEVVDWLLELKVDVMVLSKLGESAFSLACKNGYLSIAEKIFAQNQAVLNFLYGQYSFDKKTSLMQAVKSGKKEVIEFLLRLKADVMVLYKNEETVFSMACAEGDLALAKNLYACDARLLNHGNKTGLMLAVKAGKQEIVDWLLDLKPNLMIQNDIGETVFSIACEKGDLALAKRLYTYDAAVLNYGRTTGLIAAAEAGKQEVVDWLLDLKAELMIQNGGGETVFSVACKRGDLALAKRLYACDAKLLNYGKKTGLMSAVEAGKKEVMDWLLDLKADVMVNNGGGETVFSLACEKGDLLIAKQVLEKNNTELNARYGWAKRTPLMQAIYSDKKEVIEFLLSLKADVLLEDYFGTTAFSMACAKGNLALAKRLYDCDTKVLNYGQETGLIAAVKAAKQEVVDWLLDLKADVMLKNGNGTTAFSAACQQGNLVLAKRLYASEAKVLNHGRSGLIAAIEKGEQKLVEWLLDLKADVMVQDDKGATAFSIACEKGYLLIAERIFEQNEAVLNLAYSDNSWNKQTPLMRAIKKDKKEVIEFLLQLKADVLIKDSEGETSLSLACKQWDLTLAKRLYAYDARLLNHGGKIELIDAVRTGKQDIVEWLLDLKIDVMVEDHNMETAFGLACRRGDLALAKRLYAYDARLLNYGNKTGLMSAVEASKQEIVDWLLDLKTDLRIQNDKGETVFSLACGRGDLALVKRLYNYDANLLNYGKKTGLMSAVEAGKQEIVDWLLDFKPDLKIQNDNEETVFSFACGRGDLALVKRLYAYDFNLLNYGKKTGLVAAAEAGRKEIVEWLLDLNTDVTIQKDSAAIAFHMACEKGYLLIAERIFAHNEAVLNFLYKRSYWDEKTPLMSAVLFGKAEVIGFLLRLKADALIEDRNGATAFSMACKKGDLALAKRLYAYDVRVINGGKKTGLMSAAESGAQEIVDWLLDLKVDVLVQNDKGETVFSLVCKHGYLALAKRLYAYEAKLLNYGKKTGLMSAVEAGKQEVVDWLLDLKAELMIQDDSGETVFNLACERGDLALAKRLYALDAKLLNYGKKTGLMSALEAEKQEIVDWLLGLKAEEMFQDVMLQDASGKTIFSLACERGDLALAKRLYSFDARLLNHGGITALMAAIKADKHEVADWLLSLKADVTVKAENGATAFSVACEKGALLIAERVFLQDAAVLNLQSDWNKRTPLMQAVVDDKKEIIEFLLRLKADVLIEDKQGTNVFTLACKRGDLVLAKRLYAYDARLLNYGKKTMLLSAIEAGKQEVVDWLLDLKADVMIQNNIGATAFSIACEKGYMSIAERIFAQNEAVLNLQYGSYSFEKKTPLMQAVVNDKKEIIEFLLRLKADVMALNNNDETIFNIACKEGNVALAKRLYVHDIRLLNYGKMTGLMSAVAAGKQEVVDWLLDLKADVMVENGEGETVFSLACKRGDLAIAKRLYACNTDLLNYGKKTGLMLAIAAEKQEVVDWLLDLKADVMVQDNNGATAFSVACENGYVAIAERIFAENAAVLNLQYGKYIKRTPLMQAVEDDEEGIIELLLRLKADVLVMNNNKETVFNIACGKGNLELAKRLYAYDARMLNYGKKTGLISAVVAGKLEVVNWLLDLNAEVMVKDDDEDEETVFSLACKYCDLALVKRLYTYEAKLLNQGKKIGLINAVSAGKQETVEWLLDLKVDIKIQNNFGATAFGLACGRGDLALVKRLYACDASLLNHGEKTGLMLAAAAGKQEIVDWLLDLKADVMLRDNRGATAFIFACEKGYLSIAERIFAINATVLNLPYGKYIWWNMQTPLMQAVESNKEEILGFLLRLKADAMIQNEDGETVFSMACKKGDLVLAKRLYAYNADLLNYGKKTALMLAAEAGKQEIVDWLLDLKAEVMVQNDKGETIFSLACEQGDLALAKRLYAYNSDLLNYGKKTGLMLAAEVDKQEIVGWLLDLKAEAMVQNDKGETIFSLACKRGDLALAKRLYIYDARLLNFGKKTGLMAAAEAGKKKIVNWLLDLKADVMVQNDKGATAFSLACEKGYVSIAKRIFAENTAVLNLPYGVLNKQTPLMAAVQSGKKEVIEFLLGLEADVMLQNTIGETVFSMACEQGDLTLAKSLYACNASLLNHGRIRGVMAAFKAGRREVVEWLLDLKAELMFQDNKGETIFGFACERGDVELAKRLYACDASLLNYGRKTGLMLAAEADKQEIVDWLLDLKADVTIQNAGGATAFSLACAQGDLTLVKRLYAYDAKLLNYGKETGLMLAAAAGKQEIVDWLLNMKADVMIQDARGATAFILACEKGYLSVAERIFAENAAVLNLQYSQHRWSNKQTPIMQAVQSGKEEIIEFLLRLKADVMIQNEDGETVFTVACEKGNLALAKRLYAYNTGLLNYGKKTGLISAAEAGKQEIVDWLLDLKAEVMTQNNNGETIFSLACGRGDLVLAKSLYAYDVRLLNYGKNTGLMMAVTAGKQEIVDWLLDLKAELIVQNNKGETVFSIACKQGDLALAKRLYAYDAKVLNYGRMTGLIAAVNAGKQEIIDWLLDLKAEVMVQSDDGQTVFNIACGRGDLDLVKRLYACDARLLNYGKVTGLLAAVDRGAKEVVAWLLDLKADVTIEYKSMTAFCIACLEGSLDVVKWLLKADIDKKLLNKAGRIKNTALMEASSQNNAEVVQFLLDQEAINSRAENIFGDTAFSLVCDNEDHNPIIYELLYNRDPDFINHANYFGITPLMIACAYGKPKVVQFLLDKKVSLEGRDIWGMTAFDYALLGKKVEILDILLGLTAADIKYNEGAICILNLLEKTNLLVRFNAKVSDTQAAKNQALLITMSYFNFAIWSYGELEIKISLIEKLLAQGADVNCQDSQGNTPLLLALSFGRRYDYKLVGLVKNLLAENASIVHKNHKGEGALELVQNSDNSELIEFIQEQYALFQQRSSKPTLFGHRYGSATQAAVPLVEEAASMAEAVISEAVVMPEDIALEFSTTR